MINKGRKYYIIIDGVETLLNNSPEGWKDSKVQSPLSDRYKTTLRSFMSQSLIFYFEGAELLKNLYDTNFVDSEAYLKVEIIDDDYEYSTYNYGLFDFTEYEYIPLNESVSITISDNSDIVKLINRDDTDISSSSVVNIDGDTIPSLSNVDIVLQKQELTKTLDFTMNAVDSIVINSDTFEGLEFYREKAAPFSWSGGALGTPSLIDGTMTNFDSTTGMITCNNTDGGYVEIVNVQVNCQSGIAVFDDFPQSPSIHVLVTIALVNGSGTEQELYSYTSEYTPDETTGVFSIAEYINDTLKFNCKYGWYIVVTATVTLDEINTIGSDTYPITLGCTALEYVSTEVDASEEKTSLIILKSDDSIVNEFSDETNLPNGDSTDIFETSEDYTRLIRIDNEAAVFEYAVNGYDDIYGNMWLRFIHYSESGDELDYVVLARDTITSFGSKTYSIAAQSTTLTISKDETVVLEASIETIGKGVIRLELDTDSISVKMVEISPSDSEIEGYLVSDYLNHCMNVMVGENKLVISDEFMGAEYKDNTNSAYGLSLLRGSLIRGFDASDYPITSTFGDVFDDLQKMYDIGMYYDYANEYFVIDYLDNIYSISTTDEYSIGQINSISSTPFVDDIYIGVKAGNSSASSEDDYYVENESHNPTSYTFPISSASEYLDLQNTISTDSTSIEMTRRVNAVDTPNLSHSNDDKLFLLKCYTYSSDKYYSEKEERITITTSPTNFADANLALTPRWIIENNKSIILISFYKKSTSSIIQYSSSTYDLELVTNTDFSEQSDIVISDLGGGMRYIPEKLTFDQVSDDNLFDIIRSNPHRIWNGYDENGDTYRFYMKNSDIETLVRETDWQAVLINADR